jgi:hypothetical protein
MDEPIAFAFVAAALIAVAGRLLARHWIIGQYQAGTMSGRRAGWLMFMLTVAPYILLFTFMIVAAPEQWWIAVLLFVASWPFLIIPWVVVLYGNRSRKPPA